jgi:3-oxoacyl-[acyl-carrier protein] reductase
MDLQLRGRAAVVAASTRGIGFAIARGLAAEGARVALSGRSAAGAKRAADDVAAATGAQTLGIACDVSEPEQVRSLVDNAAEAFGGLDILVTNAGGPPAAAFAQLDDDAWLRAAQGTLLSVVRLVRAALPHLKKSGRGRVINVASSSVKEPIPTLMLSNSLRLAVVGLARTLSRELAPDGITVNNVCPGRIRTQRLEELYGDEAALARAAEEVPMKRLGTPDELAALAVFLAGAPAQYITGQTILVDGGLTKTMM